MENQIEPAIPAQRSETDGEYMDTEMQMDLKAATAPRKKVIAGATALFMTVCGILYYQYTLGYESTDDAQVDGHINAISSRIAGTIASVHVEDNQMVQQGAPLIDLDTRELRIAYQQSGAQFAQARARLDSENPNVAITMNSNTAEAATAQAQRAEATAALEAAENDRLSAQSRLLESEATAKRDQQQAERYKLLYDKEETSKQEYENYQTAAMTAQARMVANQAALASAEKNIQQRKAQLDFQKARLDQITKNAPKLLAIREATSESQKAGVDLAQSQKDQSDLNLSFAHIISPITGIITGRSAEPGNRVQSGEQLLMVVDTAHLWITANFKETQLRRMHPGCKVKVKVDALGITYVGSVESMPAVTGARSSVLPPENATGNYVKVIQRLPVRIQLLSGQREMDQLRPGMSAEATVRLR